MINLPSGSALDSVLLPFLYVLRLLAWRHIPSFYRQFVNQLLG